MASLALMCFNLVDFNPAVIGALIPIALFVCLFGVFLPTAVWTDHRRKEREAFYKSETLRRITESSSDGAKAALDLIKQEAHAEQIKKREGLKIGGVVCLGVGVGSVVFLWALVGSHIAMCGLIPGLVGVALLVYSYFMAAPVE